MMRWANFIHIYQPADQSLPILDAVVNQSYRRVFNGLAKIPSFKLTLNINGALTELLAGNGYGDVIQAIRDLSEAGKLEFTESAMNHAFLPFLAERDIERQIRRNHETNLKHFGPSYKPKVFFPPEMAYSLKVARVVARMGYPVLMLDEISHPQGGADTASSLNIFDIEGAPGTVAVFRERRVSNLVMSSVVRDEQSFLTALGDDAKSDRYLLTAMDGETFGHHRPGLENLLFAVMASSAVEHIFVSEIPTYYPKADNSITPREATWASAEQDIEKGVQFFSWKAPQNKVHALQWRFFGFLEKKFATLERPTRIVTNAFDMASASDQYFWASAEPWWSIEMIERGAWNMLAALWLMPGLSRADRRKGEELYRAIIAQAFKWQRTGMIETLAGKHRTAVRIPFHDRTVGEGKPEVYDAIMAMLKEKMKEAAIAENYEKAILWRDAMWKLETRNDIYDTVHAVDMLRQELPGGELEKLMDKYKEEYRKVRPGQPEFRG
ncbi:MAG: hypothetical protein Q7S28_02760 [bacterium]|nr:hypothetical protein [bacterium]